MINLFPNFQNWIRHLSNAFLLSIALSFWKYEIRTWRFNQNDFTILLFLIILFSLILIFPDFWKFIMPLYLFLFLAIRGLDGGFDVWLGSFRRPIRPLLWGLFWFWIKTWNGTLDVILVLFHHFIYSFIYLFIYSLELLSLLHSSSSQ